MIRSFKTEKAAEIMCIEPHLFKALRETGLLTGRKQGHGYVYDEEEMDALTRAARGFELTSDSTIRYYAPLIKMALAEANRRAE